MSQDRGAVRLTPRCPVRLLGIVLLSLMPFRNITAHLAIEPSVGLIFLGTVGAILGHEAGARWLTRASAGRIVREEA